MATVTVDGREYDSEKLSGGARQQLMNIAAVDEELRRLQARAAICQTARSAYLSALQSELPKDQ